MFANVFFFIGVLHPFFVEVFLCKRLFITFFFLDYTIIFFLILFAIPFLGLSIPTPPQRDSMLINERVNRVNEDIVQMRRDLAETRSALDRVQLALEERP